MVAFSEYFVFIKVSMYNFGNSSQQSRALIKMTRGCVCKYNNLFIISILIVSYLTDCKKLTWPICSGQPHSTWNKRNERLSIQHQLRRSLSPCVLWLLMISQTLQTIFRTLFTVQISFCDCQTKLVECARSPDAMLPHFTFYLGVLKTQSIIINLSLLSTLFSWLIWSEIRRS